MLLLRLGCKQQANTPPLMAGAHGTSDLLASGYSSIKNKIVSTLKMKFQSGGVKLVDTMMMACRLLHVLAAYDAQLDDH